MEPTRKGIAVTRSFGAPVTSWQQMREAIASYATRAAEKMRRYKRRPSSASSTASIEGVLIVSPWKMPSISLPLLVRRKIFGSGRPELYVSSRSTARGLRTIMPCAPSPPRTFCQDHVVTSSFFQGRSMANDAEVASQIVRTSRVSEIQSPCGTRTPEVVPFHVKTTSRVGSTFSRSGRSLRSRLRKG